MLRENSDYADPGEKEDSNWKFWFVFFWLPAIAIAVFFFFVGYVTGLRITENKAVKYIVAEAADQGYTGMVCVAEVIRHRKGVNGFTRLDLVRIKSESKVTWALARKAYRASAKTNLTHGATHFENTGDFGIPYWAKNKQVTLVYKDHVFFKKEGV